MRELFFSLSFLFFLALTTPAFAVTNLVKICNFEASGDACIFDVVGTGKGTLSVDTRADMAGDRWRVVICRVNTTTCSSNVGTGSAANFTGKARRGVVNGGNYVVIVTYERPLPGDFPTSVEVRFNGPVNVSGPRLTSGSPAPEEPQTCMQISESAVALQAVEMETIECGALIMCSIKPTGGDTDAFTFTIPPGGGAVSITIAKSGGPGSPCWRLFNPDGNPISDFVCENNGVSGSLETGTYTIEVYDAYADQAVDYSLSLQKVGGL